MDKTGKTFDAKLLVLTGTLGTCSWLDHCVESVRKFAPEATHVLIAPTDKVEVLRTRFPDTTVIPDAGKAGGLYGALNCGLRHAADWKWEWMTFLADDDLLLAGFRELFEKAQANTQRGEAAVWHGEVIMTREDALPICRVPYTRRSQDIAALVAAGYSPFNQQSMLFSREAARRAGFFPTEFRICGDASHWLKALESGARFHQLRVPAAVFRVRQGQLSGVVDQHAAEFRSLRSRARAISAGRWLWPAVARFRISNLPLYLERLSRVGWVGGFGLLERS